MKHFFRKYVLAFVLGLLLTSPVLSCSFMKAKSGMSGSTVSNTWTVAAIIYNNDRRDSTQVTFAQSQRYYKISKNADQAYLKLLQGSEQNHTPVIVKRASQQSDVILSVEKP